MNAMVHPATEGTAPTGSVTFGRGGLAGAVASEWTKLWSVRAVPYNLISAAVLMALLGVQFGFNTAYENTHLKRGETASLMSVGDVAISATLVVQVVVAAMAMLVITAEYATGSIRATLQWTPVRRNVLLAKAIVVAPLMFLTGLGLGMIGAVAGRFALGKWALVDLSDVAVDLLAIAGYLTLAGLFTLGLGVVIRSTAGTLTASFLLLLVIPIMLSESGFTLSVWIAAFLPGGAGQNLMTGSTDPLPPAVSLAVLITWAAATLYLAARTLHHRDA